VTVIAQIAFPNQSNGSLIVANGQVVGSSLIGQPFDDVKYFWGRLSATAPYAYNAAASSGSNLGPTNPALVEQVKARVQALHDADPGNSASIPIDLVTASGSGLDPDISVAAALFQASRVARVRGIDPGRVRSLVEQSVQDRQFGLLGEPRVNVLALNLALDKLR
jgi:K+-transporting ATPase KdpC subunit